MRKLCYKFRITIVRVTLVFTIKLWIYKRLKVIKMTLGKD
jgi:hypothetical protein